MVMSKFYHFKIHLWCSKYDNRLLLTHSWPCTIKNVHPLYSSYYTPFRCSINEKNRNIMQNCETLACALIETDEYILGYEG